jgi:exosome complex component RRP45
MANAGAEAGRQNYLSVHVNRFLEKCIKDSRCVDLEALCIVSEEKVIIFIFVCYANYG